MTEPAPAPTATTTAPGEAVVTAVRLAAAHDGIAELLVSLQFSNGGSSDIALDHLASTALLTACNANTPDGILGASWQQVRDALAVSWNRHQTTDS